VRTPSGRGGRSASARRATRAAHRPRVQSFSL
jgi:hypothetical protein